MVIQWPSGVSRVSFCCVGCSARFARSRNRENSVLPLPSSKRLLPLCHFAGKALVQAGQPSFLLDLREASRHGGVVGLAHHLLSHAEKDVVLLEDVLAQQRDVLPGGIGKG